MGNKRKWFARPGQRAILTGLRFGALVVLAPAGSSGKKSLWHVQCDCGETAIKVGQELKRKRKGRSGIHHCSSQCPLFRKLISEAKTTHGMSKHPAFAVWRNMIDRCRLPSHQAYHNYGARGIKVCPEWEGSFETFWSDMGDSYVSGLTLERKDNSRGYSKDNCCWATYTEQANNRRGNRLISTPWGELSLKEVSARTGIGRSTIWNRINQGWPAEKIFITPDFRNRIL